MLSSQEIKCTADAFVMSAEVGWSCMSLEAEIMVGNYATRSWVDGDPTNITSMSRLCSSHTSLPPNTLRAPTQP